MANVESMYFKGTQNEVIWEALEEARGRLGIGDLEEVAPGEWRVGVFLLPPKPRRLKTLDEAMDGIKVSIVVDGVEREVR